MHRRMAGFIQLIGRLPTIDDKVKAYSLADRYLKEYHYNKVIEDINGNVTTIPTYALLSEVTIIPDEAESLLYDDTEYMESIDPYEWMRENKHWLSNWLNNIEQSMDVQIERHHCHNNLQIFKDEIKDTGNVALEKRLRNYHIHNILFTMVFGIKGCIQEERR